MQHAGQRGRRFGAPAFFVSIRETRKVTLRSTAQVIHLWFAAFRLLAGPSWRRLCCGHDRALRYFDRHVVAASGPASWNGTVAWNSGAGSGLGVGVPTDAFLGLGSNVGSRESHLAHAITGLNGAGGVRALSSVYETDPVGFTDQGPFLNMVVAIRTEREPRELLRLIREIESERGRVPSFRNAPRTLDIDVLLFGGRVVREEGLIVPHPRMRDRPFVLVPLLEVDPEATDPDTGTPFREDLARLAGGPLDDLRAVGEEMGVRRVMAGEELLDASNG